MGNIDFRFYLLLFARRLPLFAFIAITVAAAGIAVAYLLPPVYQAEARVAVESTQIQSDLVPSSAPSEIVRQFQLIKLEMMTRANLLALADRLHLYSRENGAADDDIVRDMRNRANVAPIQIDAGSPPAFVVSYKDADPVLAATVANEFANLIVQKNNHAQSDQAVETANFLHDEAQRVGAKLNDVENQILEFKNKNKDALPETLGFRRTQQLAQQERLMQLEREAMSLQDERSRLVRAFALTGHSGPSTALTPEGQTLDQLRRVLSEQRTIYAESSPGIVALKAQIASLEKNLRSSGKDTAGPQKMPPELTLQLSDIDRRLALVSEEKNALKESLSKLGDSIAATPANEIALNALERQRLNLQAQYNTAVAKMSDASMRQRIAQQSKGERISILEPAVPPENAAGPKRVLIALGGVVAGVGLGLGLIVLLEILNKTVRRPFELVEYLEIEPLATIPYIPAASELSSNDLMPYPSTIRRALGS